MDETETKPSLNLHHDSLRAKAAAMHQHLIRDNLETDVVAISSFLTSYNVNYVAYHEPHMLLLGHLPSWLNLDAIVTQQKLTGKNMAAEIEEAKSYIAKFSICLSYDTPQTLRNKLECEYLERSVSDFISLDKALLIENMQYFSENDLIPDRKGQLYTAIAPMVCLQGGINIYDATVTHIIKPGHDPAELPSINPKPDGLTELARREIGRNINQYRMLIFSDPLHESRPN